MDAAAKKLFLHQLCDNILSDAVAKIPRMPEEWDGHELRRYLADKFANSGGLLMPGVVRRSGNSKRLAAYRNTCIVRNL